MRKVLGFILLFASSMGCHEPAQDSNGKFISANGLRRNASKEEEKPLLRVETGCTAFFIKNEANLPLVGSARHCFSRIEGGFEKWCSNGGAVFDAQNSKGTCVKPIATDSDLDVLIFEVTYAPAIEKAFNLATYVPPAGTPMQLIGYPGDSFRNGRATVSENCEITPYEEVVTATAGTFTADESLPHNCSTWGGNSGGPFIVEGTMDVLGLPGTYLPQYRLIENEEYSFGPDNRIAETHLIQTLIRRHRATLDALKVSIVDVPVFVDPPVSSALTVQEQSFSQECFSKRQDPSYKALLQLTKTTSCTVAAKKLSQVSEIALPRQGITDLNFLKSGIFKRNLRALFLQDNTITSLDGIENVKQLQLLDLSNYKAEGKNRISSIEALEDTKVNRLYLNRTGFSDLAELALVPLLQVLELDGNGITSLESLRDARSQTLNSLSVRQNQLESLQGIEAMPYLSVLNANDNSITNADALNQTKYLQNLDLSANALSSFGPFEDLSSLRTLNLSSNSMIGDAKIDNFKYLTYANLRSNRLKALTLSNNQSLYAVYADNNLLSNLLIENNPRLDSLELTNNLLVGLQGILPGGLAQDVNFLNVAYNLNLEDISALANVSRFGYLVLSDTGVRNLSVLRNTEIKYLFAENIALGRDIPKTNENCPMDAMNTTLSQFCMQP